MPKCTINGQEVVVKDGATIIEAIHHNNQKIAHYCWHPGLSVAGVCRLCMVEIEGNPRLQIACNTVVSEGMKINNTSEKVKDAAKWGLDFHLINHPLDCPICDQAGECGLQDQYMEFGKYDPEMAERKVKKKKVVDLGPTVVLDTERCILCSRCVRFTDEVSKTNELGIFNRGDRSEIGTFDGKELDNKYSLNTVDICPVGALTSKDFRFRQRVWYLKDAQSICTGCSTGCNVKVYFNKEGLFRVKPVFNEKVNGYWMCDEGRDIYKFVNKNARLLKGKKKKPTGFEEFFPGALAKDISSLVTADPGKVAFVVTGQFTNEEYDQVFSLWTKKWGSKNIFHWLNSPEKQNEFDGLLLRGDRNPNTQGLLKRLKDFGISTQWKDLITKINTHEIDTVVVAGPENPIWFPDFKEKLASLAKAKSLIWMQSSNHPEFENVPAGTYLIPLKSFVEKEGTFTNYSGLDQKFSKVTTIVSEALTLTEACTLLAGENLMIRPDPNVLIAAHPTADRVTLEHRKKNEFVFRRGAL